jgi:hypothetical protein
MELSAYIMDGHTIDIRPAPHDRKWMDDTHNRFAYRCLPLNIANAHGWEMLVPAGFRASWAGDNGPQGVSVQPDSPEPHIPLIGVSHFGHGVLTFHVTCLFRTEPGYDLMVQGPINRPKDGIAPLTGIIETDWAPYSFTMNWLFTRAPMSVRFEKGEPFCHFFPVKRGELEQCRPRLRKISENPEIQRQHTLWQESRKGFIEEMAQPGTVANEEGWQRLYHRGLEPERNTKVAVDHRTRLRLRPFES